MSSAENQAYISYLNSVNDQLQTIFIYSVPWIGLVISIFSTVGLILRKRRSRNLLIYIFKWRYAICIIYWLNILFNDSTFTKKLFKYTLTQDVSDPVCKVNFMFMRFFYCASPWMQVVIFTC